jgi:hypothetical protein
MTGKRQVDRENLNFSGTNPAGIKNLSEFVAAS